MIDHIKIRIKDNQLIQRLLCDPKLTFIQQRGKLVSKKYKDLIFNICDSGIIEITGSLHKYFNDGAHNWNDFTRVDLWDTVYKLCEWLQIDPSQAELHNVEFGVNLNVPFHPKKLLTDFIAYKGKLFAKISLPKQGTYYQAKTFDYLIKCYDKGAQYNRDKYLLRVEVKVKVMRYLKKVKIHTLQDLQDAKNLGKLGDLLYQAWEWVLIREDLPEEILTLKEKQINALASNTSSFQNLDRRKRHSIRKDYDEIIQKYSLPHNQTRNRKKEILELLKIKWDQLIKQDVCNDLHQVTEQPIEGHLQRSSIVCKRTSTRVCKVTGLTIENQKAQSVFVSEKTIRNYPQDIQPFASNHRKNYRRNNHEESYYVAHNVRNTDSNERNNLRRRVQRIIKEPSLFDKDQVLSLSAHQRKILDYWNDTPWAII